MEKVADYLLELYFSNDGRQVSKSEVIKSLLYRKTPNERLQVLKHYFPNIEKHGIFGKIEAWHDKFQTISDSEFYFAIHRRAFYVLQIVLLLTIISLYALYSTQEMMFKISTILPLIAFISLAGANITRNHPLHKNVSDKTLIFKLPFLYSIVSYCLDLKSMHLKSDHLLVSDLIYKSLTYENKQYDKELVKSILTIMFHNDLMLHEEIGTDLITLISHDFTLNQSNQEIDANELHHELIRRNHIE